MISFGKPLSNTYSLSGWGEDRSYRGGWHEGMDFEASVGTRLYALYDGKVAVSQDTDEFQGRWIVIEHPEGWTSRYMHMSERLVPAGKSVVKGQLIGYTGRTGIGESEAHVHIDIKVKDTQLFSSKFGVPDTGFGRTDTFGTTVPCEPLIPVDKYRSNVINGAKAHGIPLHKASANWLTMGLWAAAGYAVWELMRKKR